MHRLLLLNFRLEKEKQLKDWKTERQSKAVEILTLRFGNDERAFHMLEEDLLDSVWQAWRPSVARKVKKKKVKRIKESPSMNVSKIDFNFNTL